MALDALAKDASKSKGQPILKFIRLECKLGADDRGHFSFIIGPSGPNAFMNFGFGVGHFGV